MLSGSIVWYTGCCVALCIPAYCIHYQEQNMNRPDVSVIITAYNMERYIARAIYSVLEQVQVAVEVIVVDDCSRDGTWREIEAISDPRIKRIRLDSNSGPSIARNTALAAVNGK